jgi:hypothetical protein
MVKVLKSVRIKTEPTAIILFLAIEHDLHSKFQWRSPRKRTKSIGSKDNRLPIFFVPRS